MTAFLFLVLSRAIFTPRYVFHEHVFYAYLAPPIVTCVLLTCQNLDPEYKTTRKETRSYTRVNRVNKHMF